MIIKYYYIYHLFFYHWDVFWYRGVIAGDNAVIVQIFVIQKFKVRRNRIFNKFIVWSFDV